MKKTALVILLLITCIGAFAKTKKKKKHVAASTITSVMVHHSVCYGRCPEYTIEITSDGTATYTGMRFAADTGIFKKNIGKAHAKEIIDMVIVNKADTCKDVYENRISDIPSLTVTINYPSRKKVIRNATFGPEFLKEISGKMDEVGKKTEGAEGWKKVGMPALK